MIRLDHVSKKFLTSRNSQKINAVNDVSLEIAPGELLALVGPSGCGKTTLLRLIAGFEKPDSGDILFDGRSILSTPPHKRDCAIVFQSYSLFPQMTVFENIAFGLKIRKKSKIEIQEAVKNMIALVELNDLEGRYPQDLSGGQQQRVALARALIIQPKTLLLDEPLSNLDRQLKISLRNQVRDLVSRLKITTVFVTHEIEDASAIADRIITMRSGSIESGSNLRLLKPSF